jgi:hypothetical protein
MARLQPIGVLAILAIYASSLSFALAEQTAKPSAWRDASPGQTSPPPNPQLGTASSNSRAPAIGMQHAPNGGQQQARPRAVYRDVARRLVIAGGILVLPKVAFYGVSVILDVPQVGYVELPEDEYASLFDKLTSSDPMQVEDAVTALRTIKATEDAKVEAILHRRDETPSDSDESLEAVRDLSEPISFGSFRIAPRRRGLY